MVRLFTWICWLLAFYAVICAAVYFFQRALIFPGASNSDDVYLRSSPYEIWLTQDGNKLQGWYLANSAATNQTVILYFGGNAEDVVGMLPTLQKFGAAHVYTFNYRGYGKSEGAPSQAALYGDALAIYDHIATRHNTGKTRFVIIGRSLGSAVAGQLANRRTTHRLALLTPLKSAAHSGQRAYPFLPVRWLIRHPLDLYSEAAHFTFPVVMLIAEHDRVIPPADSQATFDAIASPKQLVNIASVGHNDLFSNPNALSAIQNFIAQIH